MLDNLVSCAQAKFSFSQCKSLPCWLCIHRSLPFPETTNIVWGSVSDRHLYAYNRPLINVRILVQRFLHVPGYHLGITNSPRKAHLHTLHVVFFRPSRYIVQIYSHHSKLPQASFCYENSFSLFLGFTFAHQYKLLKIRVETRFNLLQYPGYHLFLVIDYMQNK